MILSISRSFHSRQYRFFVARVSFSSSPPPPPPPPEEPPSNPQWLVEAMTKTPVLDLSERNTYSDYLHPTIDEINHNPPPRRFSEFDHVTLAIMASQGVHGAFKERMLREVMRRDKVSYGEAFKVLGKMNKVNERNVWIYKIPYVFGMVTTFSIGAAAIPCVFHKETAIWFCINFVKDDVPTEPEVLDTMFKVGTWTWGWMEPMIGTASFVLLAAQLMRSQMQKIDLKPFGRFLQSRRADYLTRKFPRYEREIVRDYAKSDPWGRDSNIARRGFPANSVIPQKSE